MASYAYLGSYDGNGKYNDTILNKDQVNNNSIFYNISQDIVDEYNTLFPGGQSVANLRPEWVKDNDLHFEQETDSVYLTFVTEGAGYKNTICIYVYDTDSPPRRFGDVDLLIIFPNSSKTGSGGSMNTGDSIHIPSSWVKSGSTAIPQSYTFSAGKSLGIALIADAWQNTSVRTNRSKYASLSHMNPERSERLRYHCITVRSSVDPDTFLIGWEDINRQHWNCDHDFNDCVLMFRCSSINNIKPESYAKNISYEYYRGTILVEDLPNDQSHHDNDYNDVAGEYAIKETIENDSDLKELTFAFHLKGRGAKYDHEFGFGIPELANYTGTATRYTYIGANTTPAFTDDISESVFHTSNTHGRVNLIPSTKTLMPTEMPDTIQVCTIIVKITLDNVITRSLIPIAPYNIYAKVFRNRSTELYTESSINTTNSDAALSYGITELYNILVLRNWTKYQIPFERTPLFTVYPWSIDYIKENKQKRLNWYSFMKQSKLHTYVKNPTRDTDMFH